jgi:hypothetical protein
MQTWGGTTKHGFTAVSRVFLRSYAEMGLSSNEAMMVLHILDYSWRDNLPFPKVETVALSMGKTDKTVRSYIRTLRVKGLLRTKSRKGRSNVYDFTPLFARLREYADKDEVFELPEWEKEPPKKEKLSTMRPRVPEKAQSDYPKTSQSIEEEEKKKNNRSERAPSGMEKLQQVIDDSLAIARKKEKRRKGLGKRLRSSIDRKDPGAYKPKDILTLFMNAWKERWPKAPSPSLTRKDLKLAKDLIEDYTAPAVAKVVVEVIMKWTFYSREFNLRGYPSIGMIFGFRNSLFPLILNGNAASSDHSAMQHDAEESREEGDEVGWGL